VESFSAGVQGSGKIKDADIAWFNTDCPPAGHAGITAYGIVLDEVVIDTAASNSHGGAAEFLSVRSHTSEKKWPQMVAVNLSLKVGNGLSATYRHIEHLRYNVAPNPVRLFW